MTKQRQRELTPSRLKPMNLLPSHVPSRRIWSRLLLSAALLAGGPDSARAQAAASSPPPPTPENQVQAPKKPSVESPSPGQTMAQPKARVMTPFGAMDFTAPSLPASAGPTAAAQLPAPAQQPPLPSSAAAPAPNSLTNPAQQTQAPRPEQQPAEPAKPVSPVAPATGEQANPPAGATPTAAPPQANTENNAEVTVALNLENADLYQVLRIIGTELKINYVVDPNVKGTVTINTSGTVSRASLFSILESILEINGAAMVKAEGYYRVVPIAEAKLSALPLEFAKAPGAAPSPGDTLVLQVILLKFVSAVEMSKILAPFVTPAGEIVVNDFSNFLLVVETPAKIKQIREIVDLFDSPTFIRQRVQLFRIVNNSTKILITELQDVFAGYALSKNSAIRFVPIESLNAVLAISPSPEVFKDVEEWIHRLDEPPLHDVGVQNFVYAVQNAKASDLRDILIELYGGEVPKPQALPQSTTPPNPMVPREVQEEQLRAQLPPAPERVQGQIRFIADNKNNALIIQATAHDYEIVKRTITQLDILPRQVLIDAKIYEVDLTGDLSFGISAFLQNNPPSTPNATLGQILAGAAGGTLTAQTFATIGATRSLQLFLNATDNRSRVRTLSAPSILVTDNTSARIQVGAEVPTPIGSALTPIQSGGTSLFAQTIQYQDTGVILTVTPHINASGIVMLTITQEVSTAVPNTTSQIVAPVINKNSFQTSVILSDGEPLALGGIINSSVNYSTNRVPILGSIPGLGALFGSTSKNTSRTELVLLLTPHVVQDVPQAAASTKDFLGSLREVKKAMGELK
jgi:general secretion pathway protein D